MFNKKLKNKVSEVLADINATLGDHPKPDGNGNERRFIVDVGVNPLVSKLASATIYGDHPKPDDVEDAASRGAKSYASTESLEGVDEAFMDEFGKNLEQSYEHEEATQSDAVYVTPEQYSNKKKSENLETIAECNSRMTVNDSEISKLKDENKTLDLLTKSIEASLKVVDGKLTADETTETGEKFMAIMQSNRDCLKFNSEKTAENVARLVVLADANTVWLTLRESCDAFLNRLDNVPKPGVVKKRRPARKKPKVVADPTGGAK